MAGFAVVVLLLAFFGFTVVAIYASRVQKAGPNEVLVISGMEHKNTQTGEKEPYKIVKGGRSFIWPVLQRVDKLSLEIMTIEILTDDVYTQMGVPVTLEGVAQIKIASDDVSIRTAAERFLSKSRAEIINVAHETLAGHLRAIIGNMTVEEIYRERDKFAQEVQNVSAGDLQNMGLGIDTFVIKDVRDKEGYLDALGRPRVAEVKRDATIAEQMAATREAEAKRDYRLQQAAYDNEVAKKQTEANLAGTLQERITNQSIRAEEVQIEIIEKEKRIQVQEQETLRMEKELQATVRKPAEAEQYRIETIANANKFEMEARAAGEASAIRQKGDAEAAAVKARGLAEAEVTLKKGLAEAEAMEKKAAAWQQYNQAAIIQQLIDVLPQVAAAIAQPLSKTDRIVIISNGDGATTGASKISADITSIIAQVPATVEALTGVDLTKTIAQLPSMMGQKPANGEEKAED